MMDEVQVRVLVADGGEASRSLPREELEPAGFRIEVVTDSRSALAEARCEHDLIVIDSTLGDGETLIDELRRLVPAVPILLLVRLGHEDLAERVRKLGAAVTLALPVSLTDLALEMRRLVTPQSEALWPA